MRPKGKLFALVIMFAAVGLLTATGAFTTVEADRTATVNVTGDASALLAIQESGNAGIGNVTNAQSGEAQIDLSESSVNDNNAQGLNPNATTTVNPLINVTNQGTQQVNLTITIENTASGIDSFEFVNSSDTAVTTVTLDSGETEELGLRIQTGSNLGEFDVDITFEAEAT